MKPIISPWVFYWIEVLGNISCLCGIVMFFASITIILCVVIFPIILDIISDSGIDSKVAFNIFKKVVIALIVLAIVTTFIPSKETMYTMLVAQNVTVENLEIATDVIQDSVDYIFDKFDGGQE